MSKEAVILAGGRGTRLLPYTAVLPKPLMPIGERCILEIVLRQLVEHGFQRVTLAVNHQAELIKAVIGDGSKYNLKISYSLEDQPLGTMGPLKLLGDLPQNFLIMNGDILTDLNYGAFFDQHIRKNSLFSISAARREHQIDYGVLEINSDKMLTGFKEKPMQSFLVSMGIYMASREILDLIPANAAFGFDHLMLKLLETKKRVDVVEHTGKWLDIGRPDDYSRAVEMDR